MNKISNATAEETERPFTARSVIASTLLGTTPPTLPGRLLVRAAALFGITEGTVRTALSRMVRAGELTSTGGDYTLAGTLVARQVRQVQSRRAERRPWDGRWVTAIVPGGARTSAQRAQLRTAATALRLAELREGVWLRPDNLDPRRLPEAAAVIDGQCARFSSRPEVPAAPDLVAGLWDLEGWAERAEVLQDRMADVVTALEAGETDALAPGFVLSASVLRLTQADPLLPPELLPVDWPGAALRADYDRYDAAYQALLRSWFRAHR